ncbi:NACHT domain-containing protein [Paraburkholderia sp. RL17-373-BIF-A]|uniref:NACHT domain-containing protein n=1 Tax=Paraburkholderia sp. RL17-373-BIF-A TaxID=3031629 RepID=UPI0038BCFED7
MTIKPTALQKGDAFRDAIADVLRTKYSDVRTEVRLGNSKKVDIVFSRHDFGRRTTFGVECKDYARPLTKEQIKTEIYSDYDPLVSSRELDRVIIATSKDVGADARGYVENVPWLSIQTQRQLEDELLGLHDYIEWLARLFENENQLSSYYVEARLVEHGPAVEHVETWLRDISAKPLAIMGGYGKGKTSFALRIVSEQAKRYLVDPTERMPVLIRLGQVVHETQLEGLFGKEFTARQPANDFKFRTLEYLNDAGRLFIVLDGFDEMKHAMSASDFRANFREFNRLLRPKAKVMMLGRPNALPTDARQLVFRGMREFENSTSLPDPNYREWSEVEIDFFNDHEINQFLDTYLLHLTAEQATLPADFREARVAEIRREVNADLLRRPVHAKLVAELASTPTFDLRGFTRHTLYSQFIERLIERDVDGKLARRIIAVADRIVFQRELAWWCWTKPGMSQGSFERDTVPVSLLEGLPNGGATDIETKLTEYLVATLTEEKEAGVLYFAHRSFLEFLVAEKVRTWTPSADQHVQLAAGLNVDIREFLDAAPDHSHLRNWYATLGASSGPLPMEYLKYFQTDALLVQEISQSPASRATVADIAILGLVTVGADKTSTEIESLIEFLTEAVIDAPEGPATMAIACLVRLRYELGEFDAIVALTLGLLMRVISRMKDAPNQGLSYFPCEIWRFDPKSPCGSITCKIAECEKVETAEPYCKRRFTRLPPDLARFGRLPPIGLRPIGPEKSCGKFLARRRRLCAVI